MSDTPENVLVEHVLDAISDQRLRAGTKLGEQALSDLFSCNRAHVRRALAILAAYHVVDLIPNRGAFVSTPSEDEARDLFQARRAIEVTIIRNVVRRADEADIANLRAHLATEDEIRQQNDRSKAIRASRDFHMLLARIGRNSVLEHYLAELTMRTSLIIGLYGSKSASLCSDDEHVRIVQSVADRDAVTAQEMVDYHLRHIEGEIEFGDEAPKVGPLSMIFPSSRTGR
ncbi:MULTISPECIES: GntR family transcriptional regulator [unclassified Roseovarius]|uniref:GntR family transcriptional regulator n=1 Tax=unclassified Roseovarius TaxID=2614913 RepID=UPI000068751A|nr:MULTISPECIES: GntR family transcriptional regulator [unclassified Roseovarius]EAQ25023.1 transcriptional regulator, GntR family protein [Roseovarius sp. 217]KJS45066.1 MAG: GntR family transcriptional regulator [Roseovarius sp. BRH_c41]